MIDLKSSLNNFAFTLQNCLFEAVKLTKNSDLINTSIVDMKLTNFYSSKWWNWCKCNRFWS